MGGNHEPTAGSLGERLRSARERSFVGRHAELDLFRSALEAEVPPFAVLHIHGPGGVGKSALVGRFREYAETVGREPVLIDGREIDLSPTGFLTAVATALGVDPDEVFTTLRNRERPVLIVDTYEVLAALDAWIRDTLLPELPQEALVVLAGRQAPTAGWRTDPGWGDLLRVIALRDLPEDDARSLLEARGVDPARHDDALDVTRGHPLALVLVADVLDRLEDDASFAFEEAPEVIDSLLERFLRQVPSDDHRRGLYAVAHAGIGTGSLLRDTVGDDAADEIFDWIRGLSFVESQASGVAMHDLVSDALNAQLRWRDPEAWARLHEVVTRHLERRVAMASGIDRHRAMFDLLRLFRLHPITRRFYEWDHTHDRWQEPAEPDDHDAIVAMAQQHEGDRSAELVRYWLDRQPEAFTVFRGGERSASGFVAHLLLGDAPGDETEVDPVLAAIWRYVRSAAPLRSGEHLRVMRFWVDRDTYQDVASHHLVATRCSLEWTTTEAMAWSFVVIADPDFFEPLFTFSDFDRPSELEVTVGEGTFGMFARDWRRRSDREWRQLLRERRLSLGEGVGTMPSAEPRLLVLAQEDFEEAVRDALRGVTRPGGLEGNPLVRSRVVVERDDGRPRDEVLVELLEEVADELSGHPRDEKKLRALDLTYFRPAPTQEAAAERLGLPFSTFRRHLTGGIEHVVQRLWELELHGG